jgi:hypothetical protein
MFLARYAWLGCLLVLPLHIQAQQTTAQPPPTVPRDAQAVGIANQALALAGGMTAISGIRDYTASGTVIYHQDQGSDFETGVTISGKDLDQFRMDVALPAGMISWTSGEGQSTTKTEKGDISQYPIESPMMAGGFALPHRQLAAILSSPLFVLSYQGIVQVDGRSLHEVWARHVYLSQENPNGTTLRDQGIEFFIDVSTFELSMVQDLVPQVLVRRLRYSNYRLVGGVLAPFTIDEEVDGKRTRVTHLSQISFNSGLQDSAFQP